MRIEVRTGGYYNAVSENKVMFLRVGDRLDVDEKVKLNSGFYYRCTHPESKQGVYVEIELAKIVS